MVVAIGTQILRTEIHFAQIERSERLPKLVSHNSHEAHKTTTGGGGRHSSSSRGPIPERRVEGIVGADPSSFAHLETTRFSVHLFVTPGRFLLGKHRLIQPDTVGIQTKAPINPPGELTPILTAEWLKVSIKAFVSSLRFCELSLTKAAELLLRVDPRTPSKRLVSF